jgi:glutathione S-transferase
MQLYTCEGSRGLRVTWAAAELGIDLPLTMLPFPPRAKAREYLAINPLGTVPALVGDNFLLTESCAIAHWLAARHDPGGLALTPDEEEYPLFLDFIAHADATLTFPQTVALRFTMFERERGLEAAGEAYGDWFGKRLIKVDRHLANREYLCGDRFTVADICIAYALWLSRMTRLSHHLTPRLAEWLETMTARPGFKAAIAREAAEAVAQGVRAGG